VNHQLVAAISLSGIGLDVLGGLYLAYDLLGGRHGPLRLLTRMVTYSIVFGAGYTLGLGHIFGISAGLATGVTIAIELHRVAGGLDHYPFWCEVLFSAIRGLALGLGILPVVGLPFALSFAILNTLGQTVAYSRGVRPSLDYSAARNPRLTRRHIMATVVRVLGYVAAAMICSTFVRHLEHPWLFALRLGLVTGVVTAVGTAVNPLIEYYADNLPEKRLGVFGIWLVLCGFALQSVQYWLVILESPAK
jgi:hypothetical protein